MSSSFLFAKLPLEESKRPGRRWLWMASKLLRSPSLLAINTLPSGRVSLLRPWLRKALARGPVLLPTFVWVVMFENFGVTSLVDVPLLTCLFTLHRDFGLRFILIQLQTNQWHYLPVFKFSSLKFKLDITYVNHRKNFLKLFKRECTLPSKSSTVWIYHNIL